MAGNDDLSPEEVGQVRALLQQRGIVTSVPIRNAEKLPSEKELWGGRLSLLGMIKCKVVFAWAVGTAILTILLLPIAYLDLKEFYVPKCRAVADQVAVVLDGLTKDPPAASPSLPPDHQDSYYAFNSAWQALPDEELQRRTNGQIPFWPKNEQAPIEPITIFSSGNSTQAVLSQSITLGTRLG